MFSPHKEMVIVLAIVTLANSCGCIGNRSAVYVCQINTSSTLNLTLYMSVTSEESWKMYLLNFSLKKAWYSKVKGQPQELGGGPHWFRACVGRDCMCGFTGGHGHGFLRRHKYVYVYGERLEA